jgi:hypothetical protein
MTIVRFKNLNVGRSSRHWNARLLGDALKKTRAAAAKR